MIPVGLRLAGRVGRRLIPVFAGVCLVACAQASLASPRDLGYEYVSPLPGARLVSPWNNVVIRPAAAIDPASVRLAALSAVGSRSGSHSGRLTVSDDARSLVFTPYLPFAEGERVSVTLGSGIRMRDGRVLPTLSFAFTTTPRDPQRGPRLVADETTGRLVPFDRLMTRAASAPPPRSNATAAGSDSMSPGMPAVSLVTSNNPDPGNVFFAPFTSFQSGGHLMILNNAAQPMFYRKLPMPAFDFKRQPNGLLTYFSGAGTYWALDSSYAVVDSFRAGNGYVADLHDLQLLPNGHALLMIYDTEPVRMDSVVPGGMPDAEVVGLVVQELDQAKNVVFQWRSWDHFEITDADSCLIGLRDSLVDYVHGNALELDSDGNVLISSRSMHEITKIDHATGDIIWRWGLYAKHNEFTFANDPMGFAAQHDIRRLPNGNVTLFDNANCPSPVYSRGVEYQLDEVNKVATLVQEFRNTPDTFTPFMGNVQRRESGCTMIGWGGAGIDPKITDLHPDGTVALALGLKFPTTWTYRAFRFPWQTSRFAVPDSLDFGTNLIGSTRSRSFTIWNRSVAPVTITSVVGHVPAFSVASSLPMTLAPGQSDSIQLRFLPPEPGTFSDTLYVRSVSTTELVAQPLTVIGSCNATGIWVEDASHFEGQSYRTPFWFRLRLPAPRTTTVSVRFQTSDGTARSTDSDYQPSNGYRVFFAPGDTETWAWVNVNGDHKVETDETFFVTLISPMNAVIDRAQAVGTILDDDRLADVGDATEHPLVFALYPSNPNPGRGAALIRYDLPRECNVRLDVFDLSGRRVESIVDGIRPAGRHEATWAPRNGTTGVFFYRLWAGDFSATRKLVLVR